MASEFVFRATQLFRTADSIMDVDADEVGRLTSEDLAINIHTDADGVLRIFHALRDAIDAAQACGARRSTISPDIARRATEIYVDLFVDQARWTSEKILAALPEAAASVEPQEREDRFETLRSTLSRFAADKVAFLDWPTPRPATVARPSTPALDPGFVYILINPTMPGLVKIGKTTRDPEGRASELSGATGVASPFVLVYSEPFQDCSRAEAHVQALIEADGFRVSPSREFFSIGIPDAIKAIQSAKTHLENTPQTAISAAFPDFGRSPDVATDATLWAEVLALADEANYGLGDSLQDPDEALRLYKHAANLGSAEACLQAGLLLQRQFNDERGAIEQFKEGARRGLADCHAELALAFAEAKKHENALKCWGRYFASEAFLSRHEAVGRYGYSYFSAVKCDQQPLAHLNELSQVRDQILDVADTRIQHDPASVMVAGYARILLCPERRWPRTTGRISFSSDEREGGLIVTDEGQQGFLPAGEILDPPCVAHEGDRFEFDAVVSEEVGFVAFNAKRL
jgi:T5orf172 domain.